MKQKILTSTSAVNALKVFATVERAEHNAKFFKTGVGEYAEGDQFLGVTVPDTRRVLRECELPLREQLKLLTSLWHEARLLAVLHMVRSFKREDASHKKSIYDAYLANTDYVNHWDLVDSSASDIVGAYLHGHSYAPLMRLMKSKSVWERRIAVIATYHDIKLGECETILKLASLLLNDRHDLIHKAVGWMLREMGERASKPTLFGFLDAYAHEMPRTMLRYAIEKMPDTERQRYLKQGRHT
jgi:3-methyladenine DNA glycosylase AlkD